MKTLRVRIALSMAIAVLLVAGLAAGAESPAVLRATLANGLRVVIVHNTLAPVVAVQVNYLAGSNDAPEGFPGMAHAQEHMMFRGSPGLPAAQLAHIMALMGGNFNADTQQTVTQYYLTVPKEVLETALQVEALRMRDVLDSQELWEQERGAIEQEVARDLSNPEYRFSMQLLEKMFPGTPYAHDALGTRPSFQQTTGAMLKKFYRDWYGPNNAILVIVGAVDRQKTLALVKRLFGPIPRRPLPARPPVPLQPLSPASLALDTDLPYGLAAAAYRLPGFDSPDFAAGAVLADVLGSRRADLYALVPAGKALFTDFSADAFRPAGYGYAMAGFAAGGDGAGLVAALREIMAGYAKNGVPADLVAAAKRHETTDAQFRKNSIRGLADAWSQALAVEGRTSPDEDSEAIGRVTVADVNRVAAEYLRDDRVVTAVLTPRPAGRPLASQGFGGGESFAPQRPAAVTLPGWARKAASLPPPPPARVAFSDRRLANGIRLIVRPVGISPTVTVLGQVKHNAGLQEPAGKEGVADLLAGLMSYGTQSLDRVAFQKAQDDIGAEIAAGTAFSLRVTAGQLDRGLALLADNLLRPALPEGAFAVVQEELSGSLAGRLDSPRYLAGRAQREGLFPRADPALREATPRTVAALTREDVVDYHARVFRPDLTTIVLVGQVSERQALAMVERYFGAWKASGAAPQTELPPVPLNKPSQTVVPDAGRVQDEVTLAETVGITRTHPDYYALELGNQVLSGSFYASRLYRELREQAGLVYTIGSSLAAGKHRSVFSVVYGCDPPNVAKARGMVVQNLGALQETLVSGGELQRAKIQVLRQIPLAEASVNGIAGRLLGRAVQGLPLTEPVAAAKRYRALTAAQIRDAFKKWIRPEAFVQVTEGSAPE